MRAPCRPDCARACVEAPPRHSCAPVNQTESRSESERERVRDSEPRREREREWVLEQGWWRQRWREGGFGPLSWTRPAVEEERLSLQRLRGLRGLQCPARGSQGPGSPGPCPCPWTCSPPGTSTAPLRAACPGTSCACVCVCVCVCVRVQTLYDVML